MVVLFYIRGGWHIFFVFLVIGRYPFTRRFFSFFLWVDNSNPSSCGVGGHKGRVEHPRFTGGEKKVCVPLCSGEMRKMMRTTRPACVVGRYRGWFFCGVDPRRGGWGLCNFLSVN